MGVFFKMLVVVGAAGPTALWALSGAELLTDDWAVAAGVHSRGFWSSFGQMAWGAPARPLAALVYSAQYTLFGQHPFPPLLVLTALNVAAALLVLKLAQRLLPTRTAVLVALIWAFLPNRGSARLWIVMLPASVAILMLLVAGLLLVRLKPRLLAAGALIGLACLAYEAVTIVGIAALAYSAWTRARDRWRQAAVATAIPLACAAYVFLRSPKRSGGALPFENASQILAANFGPGTFGRSQIAAILGTLVLVRAVVALIRVVTRRFGPPRFDDRLIAAGCVLMFLGALPFLVAGFPFATDGIFDRGNIASAFGLAVVLAGCMTWMFSWRRRPGALVLLAVALGWILALNGDDLRDYRSAARDGKTLVAQLNRDLPTIPEGGVLVVPPLPNRGGVAMFILDGDLRGRLQLERGLSSAPPIRVVLEGQEVDRDAYAYTYDWRTSSLTAND